MREAWSYITEPRLWSIKVTRGPTWEAALTLWLVVDNCSPGTIHNMRLSVLVGVKRFHVYDVGPMYTVWWYCGDIVISGCDIIGINIAIIYEMPKRVKQKYKRGRGFSCHVLYEREIESYNMSNCHANATTCMNILWIINLSLYTRCWSRNIMNLSQYVTLLRQFSALVCVLWIRLMTFTKMLYMIVLSKIYFSDIDKIMG